MTSQRPSHDPDREWAVQFLRGGTRRARQRKLAYWGSIVVGIVVCVLLFVGLVAVCGDSHLPALFGDLVWLLVLWAGAAVGHEFYRVVRPAGDHTPWGDDA